MSPLPDLQTRLQTVRSHYRVTPWIQPREDETPLLRSWQRCRDAGMRETERINFELVSRALLAELDECHGELVRAARPETERLAHALRGTGCTVLLFNARGVVIDRLCHEATLNPVLLVATRKGVNVAERCVGTTAPGISIADGVPYLVGRDGHFFANVRPFFCVAAPIDSPSGERLGALDITAYDNVPSFDIYSLVVDAAAAIENSLFTAARDRLLVHFHPRAELVGTPMEGLLEVNGEGQLTGVNRAACRLLSLPRPARLQADLVEMSTHVGLQVMARFEGEALRGAVSSGWSCPPSAAGAAQDDELHCPLPDQPAKMREVERLTIERTLAALGGNVSAAARQLGISRNTIYRRRME